MAEIVATFIELHSHDWFSPGFIAFFTGYKASDVDFLLRNDIDRFIPTSKNTYQTHALYTTKVKFDSFSPQEKLLR